MKNEGFCERLQQLLDGQLPIAHGHNEFIGHADTIRQLLEVAPAAIRDDLQALYDLLAEARDARGLAVLGVFPKLCRPELAAIEGRIADYIAEHCGLRLDDGHYVVGELTGKPLSTAWPGAGSPLTNNRFPYLLDTSASNYFSNRFWSGPGAPPDFVAVPEGGHVVLRGQYLRCRYFAFHPCDIDTNTLPTLIDADIEPDAGSVNPFRQACGEGDDTCFTVKLRFLPRPAEPEPNTIYAGEKKHGGDNQAVFLLLRTTDSVLGADPPNSTGVPLPSMTVVAADGSVVEHHESCLPYADGQYPVETTHFAALPIPDYRAQVAAGKFSSRSNWGLPYDILASDDILYLGCPYSRRLGEVFVIRGKAFRTPDTPREPVYLQQAQIRGFTITNYNFWAGICNDAIVDRDLVLDAEGYFTVVVSGPENRPRNASADNQVNWMDWGPYLDGQLTFRLLLRTNPLLLRLRELAEGGAEDSELQPYLPRMGHCAKAEFETAGWQAACQ
ncbi:hypothetical protein DWB85_17210 [Seongchinamella sediminis]|uniref:Uncharacterized protein n=1 Tax=Seongchinamella sediminis TaxID=2283635 RepID=A0A3L7DVD1_9GAMM|nr:hypothetical protein [Seongchinamella sediminis]RLQ20489.1 hypothetical protein DWB85_17210 [Seongchinamella sediminis]